jgi:hypothetical protein
MQRRSLSFILLNIIISFALAAVAITVFTKDDNNEYVARINTLESILSRPDTNDSDCAGRLVELEAAMAATFSPNASECEERLVTFVLVYTATPNPNATPLVRVVTATPLPGEPNRVLIPSDVRDGTEIAPAAVVTIDPDAIDEEGNIDPESLPEGCILHTIGDGDFPSLVATTYDISLASLMAVNNLDEESAVLLQIGDTLIIPLEGCPVEVFVNQVEEEDLEEATATTEGDEEGTPQPTETAAIILPPTAFNAQVIIREIIGAGDITTEAIEIYNEGNTVNISGWTLSDGDGNSYIIPEGRQLFSGGSITINTRVGDNVAIALYWGRDLAVFGEPGDVVVLADRDGQVQASIRLAQSP